MKRSRNGGISEHDEDDDEDDDDSYDSIEHNDEDLPMNVEIENDDDKRLDNYEQV
jgi:hypothetical protein